MKTIIMARGSSLSKLGKLKDIDIDIAIIINRFYAEISNRYVFEFLKDKYIIHILAIQHNPPCYLPERIYRKLNIKSCMVNRTEKECKEPSKLTDFLSDHPAKIELEKYDIDLNIDYLPEDINEVTKCEFDGRGLQSTGLLGIAYATHYLESKDVYIIGLDFHDTPYHAPQFSTMKDWDPRKPKTIERMKKGFEEWVRKTPDVNYKIITDSDFRFNSPNIEWIS